MNTQQLHDKLKLIQSELAEVEATDDNQREILAKIAEELQGILSLEQTENEHYESLRDRMNEAVAHLEAAHPKATLLMRQLIDQLAFMGI